MTTHRRYVLLHEQQLQAGTAAALVQMQGFLQVADLPQVCGTPRRAGLMHAVLILGRNVVHNPGPVGRMGRPLCMMTGIACARVFW